MSYFVTPKQSRLIDPYSFIFEDNKVNRQWTSVLSIEDVSLIISGLDIVVLNNLAFSVSKGQAIIDNVLIDITAPLNINLSQTSYQLRQINTIVLRYQYQEVYPVSQAYLDVTTNVLPDDLILGFLDINFNGDITNYTTSYNGINRSGSFWTFVLLKLADADNDTFSVNSDIDKHNQPIINMGAPIAESDAANKKYADNSSDDGFVKTDSEDKRDYLNTKITGLGNVTVSDQNHLLDIHMDNMKTQIEYYKKKVTSADSSFSYLGELI